MSGKWVEYCFRAAVKDLHRGNVRILGDRLKTQGLSDTDRAGLLLQQEQSRAAQMNLESKLETLKKELAVEHSGPGTSGDAGSVPACG